MLRKNQRLLDKAIRELDQQRVKLEKQEKTLVAQIKQSAQKGQIGACKIQAMDLVRTRRFARPKSFSFGNPAHTAHGWPDTWRSSTACGANCRRYLSDSRCDHDAAPS